MKRNPWKWGQFPLWVLFPLPDHLWGFCLFSFFPSYNWNIPSCNFQPWRSQMPSWPFPGFSTIKPGKGDAFTLRIPVQPAFASISFPTLSHSFPCPDYQDLRPWEIFGDNTIPEFQSTQWRVLTIQPLAPKSMNEFSKSLIYLKNRTSPKQNKYWANFYFIPWPWVWAFCTLMCLFQIRSTKQLGLEHKTYKNHQNFKNLPINTKKILLTSQIMKL